MGTQPVAATLREMTSRLRMRLRVSEQPGFLSSPGPLQQTRQRPAAVCFARECLIFGASGEAGEAGEAARRGSLLLQGRKVHFTNSPNQTRHSQRIESPPTTHCIRLDLQYQHKGSSL